jgi:hypothetical protein
MVAVAVGAYLTIPFLATDMIDKRIKENTEKAKKGRTTNKAKIKLLNWPRGSLKNGTRCWGLASLLLFLQILVNDLAPSLAFVTTYAVFSWVSLLLFGIAAFHSGLVVEFIMNPDFLPPITLGVLLSWAWLGLIDFSSAYMFISFYYAFWNLNLVTKVFALLLVVSIASSILLGWTIWKEKRGVLMNLVTLLCLSPYWFIGAIFVLVVMVEHFANSLFSF